MAGDIEKLRAEIAVIRGRAEHIRDLAWQISDDQARLSLFEHADDIDRRANELAGRVAVLMAKDAATAQKDDA